MNRKKRREASKKGSALNVQTAQALKTAIALHQQGHREQAKETYEFLVKAQPELGIAWNLLGMVFLETNKLPQARKHFLEAIKREPDNAIYHKNLGVSLFGMGRYTEAAEAQKKALTINPNFDSALSNLGICYMALMKFEDAKKMLTKSNSINSDNPFTRFGLAEINLLDGNLKEAEEGYLECLKHESTKLKALNSFISNIHKVKDEDDAYLKELKSFEKIIDQIPIIERANTYYALGRSYKDLKKHDESFEYIKLAGQTIGQLFPYDYKAYKSLYERAKKYFSLDVIKELQEQGIQSQTPVFIIGPPRSGTTLLEQIIHAHKNGHGVGEDQQFREEITRFNLPDYNNTKYPFYVKTKKTQSLEQGAKSYSSYIEKHSEEATRIVNKAINNIVYLPLIRSCFPQAKIIFCYRNPLDSCISAAFQNFVPGYHPYTSSMENLGKQYRLYYDLMEHWQNIGLDDLFVINYEDLVDDFENKTRQLIDYLELPWDESCLSFYEQKRTVATASATQVTKPIYKSALNRWKNYEKHLAPLVRELGPYAPEDSLYILEKFSGSE